MSAALVDEGGGPALWQALFRPESLAAPVPRGLVEAAARLGELTSPALAAFLLERAASCLGVALVDRRLAEHSRLEARFTRAAQLGCVRRIEAAGIRAVYLKGFANAHTLYPDPDLRLFGDLDVLVEPQELERVVALLEAEGFSFRPITSAPWGFQPEGSFWPFASRDDACNLDLHTEPDSYPINRALTASRVFAAARELAVGELRLRAPSAEHSLVLCLSNAAKDKLGPFALRKLIDALRLIERETALDWDEVLGLLREGRLLRPSRVIFALLAALGAPLPGVPAALLAGAGLIGRGEFARLLEDHRRLHPHPLGVWATLRREVLLAAEPRVALRLNLRRALGLLRPRTGLPPGHAAPPRETA